jgi:putative RNA 2'-phosphotransferase
VPERRTLVRRSKWLSRHLRHAPGDVGLELGPGGWVAVADVLEAARRHGCAMSREQLEEVVRLNDKQRFAVSADGALIRANQGHTVEVDLQLERQQPPAVLFHGTGRQHRESILETGLVRGRRHHVHLSRDHETARRVGARHGQPLVFRVDAAAMSTDGFSFWVSANGVWLCDAVPPAYLTTEG